MNWKDHIWLKRYKIDHMNTELSDKIKNNKETYEIIKKGLFINYRARKELEKIKDKVNIISITAYYDFMNPLLNEYKIVYKVK